MTIRLKIVYKTQVIATSLSNNTHDTTRSSFPPSFHAEIYISFPFQLDFQLSVYASPAVDIFMALYGSMTLTNRKTYRNEIILFYYETFVSSLRKFGYEKEPPSLLDLNVELTKNGALGAQLCICYVPYLLAEWSKIDSNVMYAVNEDTESLKRKLYLDKKFGEVIKDELEDFFFKGYI